jgi:hypothetical protein
LLPGQAHRAWASAFNSSDQLWRHEPTSAEIQNLTSSFERRQKDTKKKTDTWSVTEERSSISNPNLRRKAKSLGTSATPNQANQAGDGDTVREYVLMSQDIGKLRTLDAFLSRNCLDEDMAAHIRPQHSPVGWPKTCVTSNF